MPGARQKLRTRHGFEALASVAEWIAVGALGVVIALLARGKLDVPVHAARVLAGALGLVLAAVAAQIVLRRTATRFPAGFGTGVPAGRLSPRPLDYLVSLLNVTRAVGTDASLTDLGQVIVDSCRDCFECDEVSLMMLDGAGEELEVVAFAGHRDVARIRNARVRLGESVAGAVAESRRPLLLGSEVDPRQFPGFQPKLRKIHSSMVAPIVVKDRVVGVLNASVGTPTVSYGEDDLRILCILAEHAGIVAAKSRDTERVARVIRRLRGRYRRRITLLESELEDSSPIRREAA